MNDEHSVSKMAEGSGKVGATLKVGHARDRFRLALDTFYTSLCTGVALLTLIPLFSIVYLVVIKGVPQLGLQTFTALLPAPGVTGGGLANAIQGTLVMVAIALLIAMPLGICSAIYVCEYNRQSSLAASVRFVAKLLTGVPSIICGVFAFAAVVIPLKGVSALAGGVALSVLTLPTIILTSEQALLGVPHALREASYGIGATKFQTIFRVILPEALPAIMTGVMLAVARAAGETAPVFFTAGLFSQYWLSSLTSQPTASLAATIYSFSGSAFSHEKALAWTASLVLVAFVTAANVIAQSVFSKRKNS
jgi:phosphate transport system permease protein